MSRKSSVALCGVVILAIGGWAFAENWDSEQNESPFLRSLDAREEMVRVVEMLTSDQTTKEQREKLLWIFSKLERLQTTLEIVHQGDYKNKSMGGSFDVAALGELAILLDENSGQSWLLKSRGNVPTWIPIHRTAEAAVFPSTATPHTFLTPTAPQSGPVPALNPIEPTPPTSAYPVPVPAPDVEPEPAQIRPQAE